MADTVLIAEDDGDIIEILSLYLGGSGYEVRAARNGADALEILRREQVAVALVDIMMPKMNGYDLIKAARAESQVPIIIISARAEAADKIIGLDAGADGYITKPFDPLEVTAYIRAVLRRGGSHGHATQSLSGRGDGRIQVGDLEFDTERLCLAKGGEPIALTAAELRIVAALMSRPGRIFTKAQLYACVNGRPCDSGANSVMVHISNIRAKLEDDPLSPRFIKTVRGLGYRLEG
ncbi:two component transcriptional regulator, winged helix family [Coriobacterium glomerans PW2]|uniref:Two component transcriptional regulator, winged helix family n=1 Tax=Coriobacterium glomerans (strain ATCC 49209 / DSM 20642 / JCM 10262 / PW2) TaxID=700015 RepID=F2N792_CORGP|nr:response regulator transcription factor [Coriobacterium glomerans]AEB06567.1 two component transcriptional regulator, winged helix family [Coriobacterium glomerans PW2]